MSALLDEIELDSARCYFAGVEFNVTMTAPDGDVFVYFDRRWVEIDGDESGVSVHRPTALMHMIDAPTIAVGNAVSIGAVSYVVRDIQLDEGETGDGLLVLST